VTAVPKLTKGNWGEQYNQKGGRFGKEDCEVQSRMNTKKGRGEGIRKIKEEKRKKKSLKKGKKRECSKKREYNALMSGKGGHGVPG